MIEKPAPENIESRPIAARNKEIINVSSEEEKVRLVIQGQHMRLKDDNGKDDYTDVFSPVAHASGLRILLAIATENDMFTDHVGDISQAFTQGDL